MPAIRTPEQLKLACQSLRTGRDLASTRDWALDLLDDIHRGRVTPPTVAHPLGFFCVPLYRHGPRGLCLHVWPGTDGEACRRTVIHAHSWMMTSLILLGELINENIEIEDHGNPTHRVLRVLSWRGVDRVTPTSRLVRPATSLHQRLTASSRYRLDAGTFHRTVCPQDVRPATLVLGDHRPAIRDFLLGDPGKGRYMMVRRHCEQDEVRRTVAAALGGGW